MKSNQKSHDNCSFSHQSLFNSEKEENRYREALNDNRTVWNSSVTIIQRQKIIQTINFKQQNFKSPANFIQTAAETRVNTLFVSYLHLAKIFCLNLSINCQLR